MITVQSITRTYGHHADHCRPDAGYLGHLPRSLDEGTEIGPTRDSRWECFSTHRLSTPGEPAEILDMRQRLGTHRGSEPSARRSKPSQVPHRGGVITAEAIADVAIAVVSIPLAFGIGALGKLLGTAMTGVESVWGVPG